MRAMACARRGDVAGACYHMHCYFGLLASITASGNGLTELTPMKVISVTEEYWVLEQIGARVLQQSLIDGRLDAMDCQIGNERATYYFDVTIPMQAIGAALRAPAPGE
jgi:hypothetical protein